MEFHPFDEIEFEQMKDNEFYLQLTGTTDAAKQILNRYERELDSNKPEPAGCLGDIISRAPGQLHYWALGNINQAIFEDGTPIGQNIIDIFGNFIFNLEEPIYQEGQPTVLMGEAMPYDWKSDNVDEPLEQKVFLHMSKPLADVKYNVDLEILGI